jgi:hypothetical protein
VERGERLPNGVYFYRVDALDRRLQGRFVVAR